MPVAIEVKYDYVVLKYSGKVTATEVEAARPRILQVIAEHNMSKLCVDWRDAERVISSDEQRAYMEANAKIAPPRPHTAVLGRPDQQGDLKFIEDFSVARGMPIRAFTEEQAALSWLKE